MASSCPFVGAAGTRLCSLVAPRAGAQVVLLSAPVGAQHACSRDSAVPWCRAVPCPHACSGDMPHLAAGCSPPSRLRVPMYCCPCRALAGLTCSPSPGCSSCPMAPCKSTLFGCRIPATTSAWPPALLALTGEAWTSVSWVSRKVSWIPPVPPLPPPIAGQLSLVQRCTAAHPLRAAPSSSFAFLQFLLPSLLAPPASPCWPSSRLHLPVMYRAPLHPGSGGRRTAAL